MTYEREMDDERGGEYGDPRRCKVHGCVTSSPDGMFDAPCPQCENEIEDARWREHDGEAVLLVVQPAPVVQDVVEDDDILF